MSRSAKPLIVAGAGPAGLTAAIVLARAGHAVRVIEQRSTVGARFNDDFQGLENWTTDGDVLDELTGAGLEPTWWSRPFFEAVLYDPALRPATVRSPRAMFYMVRRGGDHPGSLDRALLDQATRAGVEVVFGRRADVAKADIVASGPSGRPVAIARGLTFATSAPEYACALLNDAIAPSGYAYFLVAGGQATLATVLFERFPEVHESFRRTTAAIERLCGVTVPSDARIWGGQGSFGVPRTCVRGDSRWVGEAAGFQDVLFGFGIRSALVSGTLAARSILEDRSYDELWRERLLPHLKASVVNRMLYGGLGDIARRLLWRVMGEASHPCRVLRRVYGLSPVHRIFYPFCREARSRSARAALVGSAVTRS